MQLELSTSEEERDGQKKQLEEIHNSQQVVIIVKWNVTLTVVSGNIYLLNYSNDSLIASLQFWLLFYNMSMDWQGYRVVKMNLLYLVYF